MNWIAIALALIKIAGALIEWRRSSRLIAEGEQKAIAAAAAEILRKTEFAKHALEEFSRSSESDVDDFLRSLEPRDPDRK